MEAKTGSTITIQQRVSSLLQCLPQWSARRHTHPENYEDIEAYLDRAASYEEQQASETRCLPRPPSRTGGR